METDKVKQLLSQPADKTFHWSSFREEDGVQAIINDEKTNKPIVWIIPNVLSPHQCDDLIEKAEAAGMSAATMGTGSIRTSKRTNQYMDQELSCTVFSNLDPSFMIRLKDDDGLSVDGVHPNWRIVRYDKDDYFCPHYDQADILNPKREDGTKEFFFSSHTLVVNISRGMTSITGGATRFYPRRDYTKAIDISVPKGWAIAFKQNGTLHAGHQVISGTKYVAQAGLLGLLPKGRPFRPSTFKVGPDLDEAVRAHAQSLQSS